MFAAARTTAPTTPRCDERSLTHRRRVRCPYVAAAPQLRAFLQYNDAFEVLLFPALLQDLDKERYLTAMPGMINGGGAFWMRKVR